MYLADISLWEAGKLSQVLYGIVLRPLIVIENLKVVRFLFGSSMKQVQLKSSVLRKLIYLTMKSYMKWIIYERGHGFKLR